MVSIAVVAGDAFVRHVQPPAGSQMPEMLQAPDRQITPAFPGVQTPPPTAKLHLLSAVSQVKELHTRVPAAEVQMPLSVGLECEGSTGIGAPFGSFRAQVNCDSSHQSEATHCESLEQPTRVVAGEPSRVVSWSDDIP